jgi:hypothetical protein
VIVGYVDCAAGPAVSYRLRELLRQGDEVVLTGADGVLTFVVDKAEQYPKDAFPTEGVHGGTNDPGKAITSGFTDLPERGRRS